MQHAPAVQYPVGRSRFHLVLIVLLGSLGALALSGWLSAQDDLYAWQAASWTGWLATTAWASVKWWRTPVGELAWSGNGWSWTQQGQANAVLLQVELDLQQTLLLRLLQPARHARWLWLERSRQPTQWLALRRALFAPTRAPTGAQAPENQV
ncbi:MAG: hypothetical protein PHH58_12250 [Rhodoferax sp.]|nr:hypothetical protein [Rhodoferax sp.]